MVGREGFEPPKAEPSGLQPDPFDRFGTYPRVNRFNNIEQMTFDFISI